MTITILTLFPEMLRGPFDSSILKRAQEAGFVIFETVNIRNFATDRYKTVDGPPYGGGVGMIMRVDVMDRALSYACSRVKTTTSKRRIILLDPQGTVYTQKKARELTAYDHIILICGHYEGIDERIRALADEELSLGDYILTGGEIPAMCVADSIVRLLPGVLRKASATRDESFSEHSHLLEYPQYTRPQVYRRKKVPDVLLSGNHANIAAWHRQQSLTRTQKRRPDLTGK